MDSLFVPTAEAAFIAGVSDREMNRAVDERILPESLIESGDGRRFARLGAALAGFYFKTEDIYVAPFRRRVLREIVVRLERLDADLQALYALKAELSASAWQLEINSIRVDLARFVDEATRRVKEIDRAESLISADPGIMSGMPVFAGTRVPVEIVTASLNKGIDGARILKAYPSLTPEHLEAAKVHAEVHPKRGRPNKALSAKSSWKVKSGRRVD
jgi:uncharacterized protein (DUF433 family)